MSELAPLQAKLDALIAQLSRTQAVRLSRKIAKQLATSQRQRIVRQQNPDGSAFAPRKPQKSRKGSIKQQAMFRKLRTARLMRTKATADGVEIGYTGANAQIARVHQFGLRSRVVVVPFLISQYYNRNQGLIALLHVVVPFLISQYYNSALFKSNSGRVVVPFLISQYYNLWQRVGEGFHVVVPFLISQYYNIIPPQEKEDEVVVPFLISQYYNMAFASTIDYSVVVPFLISQYYN